MRNYKVQKSDILFKGKVFNLQLDEIEYNSGNRGIREVVVHPGGAIVVPVKNDGKIVLVNQFRYPLQNFLLELPAGKLDKNERPIDCAERELEEETGYKANKVTELGYIYTTPGYSTEKLQVFLAEDLIPGKHNREEGEHGMEVYEFTLEEVERKILTREIVDSKTISGMTLYKLNKI